jgi:DNA invertase Pin-like site-specific DNA recombinase
MAQVGYGRVGSVGQSLAIQLDKLRHCDKIFQETIMARGETPPIRGVPGSCAGGDILMVTRLDRLACPKPHLCQIAAELARKQVHSQVLD